MCRAGLPGHLGEPWSNFDVSSAGRLLDEESRGPPKTFDLLASQDKELFWIENTTRRFKDGYNYFGRHPEKVISFFDRHMK